MQNKYAKQFGEIIKKEREVLHMTKTDLAKKLGLHMTYISQIEKGLKMPTADRLFELQKTLKIDDNNIEKLRDLLFRARTWDEENKFSKYQNINRQEPDYLQDMLKSIPPETLRLLHDPEVIEVLSDERAVKFIKVMAKGQKINAEDFRAFLADLTNMKKEKLSALIRLLQIG